jgi:hypothetical protein
MTKMDGQWGRCTGFLMFISAYEIFDQYLLQDLSLRILKTALSAWIYIYGVFYLMCVCSGLSTNNPCSRTDQSIPERAGADYERYSSYLALCQL